MPGIYVHIPFCRQACSYCDFHFSVSLKYKNDFLAALKKEISLRKNYLEGKKITSVYFGGGTPSLLSVSEIMEVFEELDVRYAIASDAEITLETNPDDLALKKLRELSHTPVNRLSIGVQSFSAEELKFLNRMHDAAKAISSVKNAQDAGFENISIDLIYGTPALTHSQWKKNLAIAFSLSVPHISCYCLTVEPNTQLHHSIKRGNTKMPDEKKTAEQFEILMDEMEKNKFIHYEISNFCRKGFHSRHNSLYWDGGHYLGLGPSAHSYDGNFRQWNVASNAGYIQAFAAGKIPVRKEELSEAKKFNEYIMLSLRTLQGTDLSFVKKSFGEKYFSFLLARLPVLEKNNWLEKRNTHILLTRNGKLFADRAASELFFFC